jgi:DNA-directed RNA polymerase subunit RPC12/RpoP
MSFGLWLGLLFVWGISALVAGMIASDRGLGFLGFAAVTFFFLGPLGPGFALIAPHGAIEDLQLQGLQDAARSIAKGRRRFLCPRCGADNDIPEADTSYDCWRCSEHRPVKPKSVEG